MRDSSELLLGWTCGKLENELTISSMAAHAAALEDMAGQMLKKAGELFASNQDHEAKWFRDEVVPMLKLAGEEYRKKQGYSQYAFNDDDRDFVISKYPDAELKVDRYFYSIVDKTTKVSYSDKHTNAYAAWLSARNKIEKKPEN